MIIRTFITYCARVYEYNNNNNVIIHNIILCRAGGHGIYRNIQTAVLNRRRPHVYDDNNGDLVLDVPPPPVCRVVFIYGGGRSRAGPGRVRDTKRRFTH